LAVVRAPRRCPLLEHLVSYPVTVVLLNDMLDLAEVGLAQINTIQQKSLSGIE